MTEAHLPIPNPVELQILQVLWDRGSATVREVHEVLSRDRTLAYTSVLSMLQYMERKGLVSHEQDGRAYRYEATRGRRPTLRRLTADLIERAFGGAPTLLLQQTIEDEDISPEELRELKQLIDRKALGGAEDES